MRWTYFISCYTEYRL